MAIRIGHAVMDELGKTIGATPGDQLQLKGRKTEEIGILLVILLNVGFAFGVMWAMKDGADEPVTLIREWFKWTGIELSATAGIKFAKIVAEAIRLLKGVNNDKDSGEENVG